MARAKTSEQARAKAKAAAVEEATRGIEHFQELLAQVEDLCREGFPYRDAVRAKTELQIRDTIRRLFGEKSPEYQNYKSHKLRVSNRTEVAQSLGLLKGLIAALEDRKLDLLGLKPPPVPAQPTPATQPATPPQLSLVPPTTPPHVTITPVGASAPPVVPSAVTMSVALVTNLAGSQTPQQQAQPTPAPPPAVNPAPAAVLPPSPTPIQQVPLQPVASTQVSPQAVARPLTSVATTSPPAPPAPKSVAPISSQPPPLPAPATSPQFSQQTAHERQFQQSGRGRSRIASRPSPIPAAEPQSQSQPRPAVAAQSAARDINPAPTPTSAAGSSRSSSLATPGLDPLESLRKICKKFHAIARQLRLRGERRATLEVEDEYDVQDLFYALLQFEFDEVASEDWTPTYADNATRSTFLVARNTVAVVVKKTRPGLGVREIIEQAQLDSQRYSARPGCTTLFCFIYDPEGRIGNPRGLESDLTMVSDRYTVEVVIAPK